MEEKNKIENKIPPTMNPFSMEGNLFGFSPAFSISFTIILCFLGYFIIKNADMMDSSHVDSFLKPYSPIELNRIKGPLSVSVRLDSVKQYYKKEKYLNAIRELRIVETIYKNDTLQFYKYVCLTLANRNDEALRGLQVLEKKEVQGFYNQIQWYIAMNSMQKKELSLTKISLQNILKSDESFAKEMSDRLINISFKKQPNSN